MNSIIPIYFVAIILASLLGGKLSSFMTLTHTRMQIMMSLVSGFIIGIAIHHLLPDSVQYISGPTAWEQATEWMFIGIISMILLLQIFNFHQHELHEASESPINPASLWGVVWGLILHSLVEGAALGAGVLADLKGTHPKPESLGIFLVILLHKPLDAWSIAGLMKSSGRTPWSINVINILFSLITPLGMVLAIWGMGTLITNQNAAIIGYVLAFSSGTFLCIALSDLLPEIQFHHHDRGKLSLAFLGGIALSYGLTFI